MIWGYPYFWKHPYGEKEEQEMNSGRWSFSELYFWDLCFGWGCFDPGLFLGSVLKKFSENSQLLWPEPCKLLPSLELAAKTPENGWLEYFFSCPFGALGLFSGANLLLVSGFGYIWTFQKEMSKTRDAIKVGFLHKLPTNDPFPFEKKHFFIQASTATIWAFKLWSIWIWRPTHVESNEHMSISLRKNNDFGGLEV